MDFVEKIIFLNSLTRWLREEVKEASKKNFFCWNRFKLNFSRIWTTLGKFNFLANFFPLWSPLCVRKNIFDVKIFFNKMAGKRTFHAFEQLCEKKFLLIFSNFSFGPEATGKFIFCNFEQLSGENFFFHPEFQVFPLVPSLD